MTANPRQECLHGFGIFMLDDVHEQLQLFSDFCNLPVRIRIEQYFLQEIVVFIQHALGYLHMTLERRSRSVLMFHHGSEDKRRDERDTQ